MLDTETRPSARGAADRVTRASRRALEIERVANMATAVTAMPEGRGKRRLMAKVDQMVARMQRSPL